jgi:hypothetical protein
MAQHRAQGIRMCSQIMFVGGNTAESEIQPVVRVFCAGFIQTALTGLF